MASKRDLLSILEKVAFNSLPYDNDIAELEKQRDKILSDERAKMAAHINKMSPLWTATEEGLAEYHILTITTPKDKGHCGCPDTRVTLHAYKIKAYKNLVDRIVGIRRLAENARNAFFAIKGVLREKIMIEGGTEENVKAVMTLRK